VDLIVKVPTMRKVMERNPVFIFSTSLYSNFRSIFVLATTIM
jgi:hypothetical protein